MKRFSKAFPTQDEIALEIQRIRARAAEFKHELRLRDIELRVTTLEWRLAKLEPRAEAQPDPTTKETT